MPKLLYLLIIAGFSTSLLAQEQPVEKDSLRKYAPNVFLDCRGCDMNYTREEIPWVNYVRDVREAEVYVLVTSQNTGSGGNMFTYKFQGLDRFEGMNDTLSYSSAPDATTSETREHRTNLLKAGLLRYAARTPIIDEINISHNGNFDEEEVEDNWRNWVFEIETNPEFTAEESYRRVLFNNSLLISKVTPEIKLEVDVDYNYSRQRYIDEEEDTAYIRSVRNIDILLVKSISDHWSAGLRWDLGSSTSRNYSFNNTFLPTAEYNLFPYSEATHHQLRFQYGIGYQYSNYIDSTIYNKTEEHLFLQRVGIAYQVQEKWGYINLSTTYSGYLHDLSKTSVELFARVRVRIIKGLSFSVGGGGGYINDQLSLAKGELSEAERLLRLKEQATSYSLRGEVSITYTFGSIYNNVVNPRFGNGGGR
ncbi:MAG: hypothetical protein L0Y37_00510 [Bacteroidales bacterium]|nr:hypothetical protein [Bacteroidales bacterium]